MIQIRNNKTGKVQPCTKEQYEKLKKYFPGSFALVKDEPTQVDPDTVQDDSKLEIVKAELSGMKTKLEDLQSKTDLTGEDLKANKKAIKKIKSDISESELLIAQIIESLKPKA